MRSFFLAAALCLTCVLAGCDAPVDTAKPVPPPVAPGAPEVVKPTDGDKMAPAGDKMAPAPTPTPTPAPAPEKPAPAPDKPADPK